MMRLAMTSLVSELTGCPESRATVSHESLIASEILVTNSGPKLDMHASDSPPADKEYNQAVPAQSKLFTTEPPRLMLTTSAVLTGMDDGHRAGSGDGF